MFLLLSLLSNAPCVPQDAASATDGGGTAADWSVKSVAEIQAAIQAKARHAVALTLAAFPHGSALFGRVRSDVFISAVIIAGDETRRRCSVR